MPEKECKKCGMPLENPDEACSCSPDTCKFCCECAENCDCGCSKE